MNQFVERPQMNMNVNQMGQQNQQWNNYNNMGNMQQTPQQQQPQGPAQSQGNQQFYNQGMGGNMAGTMGAAPQSELII